MSGERRDDGGGRSERAGSTRRPRRRPRDRRLRLRAAGLDTVLAAPLVLYLLALTAAPIVETLRLSMTDPEGGLTLANYAALAGSGLFRRALLNTVVVALLSLSLELVLGLLLALTLHRGVRLRGLVRTLLLLPLGVPTIVSGAIMLLIFSRSGYLNAALGLLGDAVGGLGVAWRPEPLAWTVTGGWRTLLTLAIADTWKVLPVVTLVLLAGLQSIPEDVYEAAAIDAATTWGRFAHVTLPLLLPYVTIALVLRAIDGFRIFELALVLAGRVEPVLGTYIWSRYAPPTSDAHAAAAAAMVLFTLILAFVVLYLRLAGRRQEATA